MGDINDEGDGIERVDEGEADGEQQAGEGGSHNGGDLDDDLHHGERRREMSAADEARDHRHTGRARKAHQARGQGAHDVKHREGRVGHSGVDRHGAARQDEGRGGPEHDDAAVDRVADGAGVERTGDEREELGQADRPDLQGRVRHGVHLVGDGHDGELRAHHGDQLAREDEAEVAALAQRGGVHQDPARHAGHLTSRVGMG